MTTAAAQAPGKRITAPIDKVHTSTFHKRTNWGDLNALASSIVTVGLIHDPVARPHPTLPGEYEMVAGERRKRACALAGLAEIPLLLVDLDDVAAIDWQYRENYDREDLHPLDEADYYQELISRGFSPGDIAKRFARKRVHILRTLKLLGLAPVARAAFAKGDLDHEAAMAIALRLGDNPAKQSDVISAVQSGALQVEEVPSYVAREYSAPLDDLPWLLSDGDMPGGSCVSCPKRAQVQRELFTSSDDKAKDRCLDVECWRAKMERCWQNAEAEPAYTKMDEAAPELFIPQTGGRPKVMASSGMVDASWSCPVLTGYTWEEAITNSLPKGAEPPSTYLARDQDGRPRLLYKESIVLRIVRKSDAGKEAERIERASDPQRPDDAGHKRAESRVRRAMVDQILARVVENDVEAWGWIVDQIAHLVSTRSVGAALNAFNAQSSAELAEQLRDASNRKRKQIALTMLVREVSDGEPGIPDALKDLCSIAGIDLQAIESAIRKDSAE